MDSAAVTSETSVRATKRGRVPVGDRSRGKSSGFGSPSDLDQVSEDGSFEDEPEEPVARPKRRRAAGASAAASKALKDGYTLIDIIKQDGKLVNFSVKQWVERYEKDRYPAIASLLMSLFESCGATYKIDASAVDEIGVDTVVFDLVNLARNGDVEDYYNSKNKDLKSFKDNLSLFWDTLVIECQNGPLFDKFLFEKCTDYVIGLSCTPPRGYRQVASLVGLQLVTSIITVAKTLGGQRETTQRQLNAEQKKGSDGPRVETLTRRLSLTHEKITSAEEMMRKIFTGLFMHRYRDVEPDIRMSCIKALGVWVLSYPSLFLQDSYLKYLGWTLNDKSPGVRKTSVLALQNLYEVDDNVPSLGLFTARFSSRVIELADDIDISVAVSAIGLLKLLLRHQLLEEEELGPLYDLLIDEPAMIRRAIGELVYDHLIAQKCGGSQPGQNEEQPSQTLLERMLHILREFPDDPILISYVIDDVWDDMNAMKDWKCIISMLLDESSSMEPAGVDARNKKDVDATNLIRLLHASAKKAVGEKIVPTIDNRKQYYNKSQKEMFDGNRREFTTVMLKDYPLLLRKYASDKAKISPLAEITMILKLELYSLKRQELYFKEVVELLSDAFFKHGDKDALRSCVKAIAFCSTESQADLQDFAQTKLKELEDNMIHRLKTAIKEVAVGSDEYSLLVNLKRLYEFQLTRPVVHDGLYDDMANILRSLKDLDFEVICFLLLNMYLHVAWCLQSIDDNKIPSDAFIAGLVSKRDTLFEQLVYFLNLLPLAHEGRKGTMLACRVCIILAEMWCLFKKPKYSGSKLESFGYCPDSTILEKFWKLCELQLSISDEMEDEDANEEYIEDTNRDAVIIAAAKLVASNTVPVDYLGSQIISHLAMHETSVGEIIKHLISFLKRTSENDVPRLFLEALRRAYLRHMGDSEDESLPSKSFSECRALALRLSGTFCGAGRNRHKPLVLQIVKGGISFAFVDAPKQLSFLECAVLPFMPRLPALDALDILKDVQGRSVNVNTHENPSGWRPYYTFLDQLREKYVKNDDNQDGKEANVVRRGRGRPRKVKNIEGRKLFTEHESGDEDSASGSERSEDEDVDEQQPLIHTFRSSASKLRALKGLRPESIDKSASSKTSGVLFPEDNA